MPTDSAEVVFDCIETKEESYVDDIFNIIRRMQFEHKKKNKLFATITNTKDKNKIITDVLSLSDINENVKLAVLEPIFRLL